MDDFKWMMSYVKPYRLKMAIAFTFTLINTFLSNIRPYITGLIIDRGFAPGAQSLLFTLVGALIGAILLKDAFRVIDHYFLESVSQEVIYSIRNDLYKNLQKQDFEFFDKNRTGDIMNRMTGDIEAMRHFIAWVMNNVFENIMLFLSAVGILSFLNWRLTVCLFMVSPIIAYLAIRLSRQVGPAFHRVRASLSNLNTVVQENISGNRVVKAFAKEDYEMRKFDEANNIYKNANIQSSRIWQKFLPIMDPLASSLNVIIMIVGGILVIKGDMTLGALVTFNSMSWALNGPMRMVGWQMNDISRAMASAQKVRELMDSKPSIHNTDKPVSKERFSGKVEFKNVYFSYGNEPILEDISFVAYPGQTVALIGPTGSGKSTLVNLICRFYDITRGEVLIDDINVKNIHLKKLRKNISVAMQDVFLFSDTIEGNIAFGVPNASLEDIKRVAKAAGADSFIRELPDGYDTIIGERGVGLSGGQKQRIALARALLKNPSILILDDTTSSVDIETEHYIQKALKNFTKDKTTFIIAHRISSVKDADLILVLDGGKIVERGTHEELLAQNGLYKTVYDTQYGDFDRKEDLAGGKEQIRC